METKGMPGITWYDECCRLLSQITHAPMSIIWIHLVLMSTPTWTTKGQSDPKYSVILVPYLINLDSNKLYFVRQSIRPPLHSQRLGAPKT